MTDAGASTTPGGDPAADPAGDLAAERRLLELLVLAVMVVWAANFIAVKVAIEAVPPVVFAFVRFGLAAICLLAIARRIEGALVIPRRDLVPIMALGGLGFGLYQILWTTALADTTAGTSSLLIATTPIFTMLLASVAGSDRLGPHRLAGAALSFGGVALVAAAGDGLGFDSRLVGELMTLAASVSWGIYLAFGSPFLRRHSPLLTTAWAMAGGSLVLAPLGIAQLGSVDAAAITPGIVAAFVFSAVLAAAAANVIVFRAVRLLGPTRVANFQFLVPAIAVVLGALLLGERVVLGQVVGGAGIVAGILVARRAPPGAVRRPPAAIEAEQIEPA